MERLDKVEDPKRLKIIKAGDPKRLPSRQAAEADLIIDGNGVVIKDRHGVAHREATPEELRAAVRR